MDEQNLSFNKIKIVQVQHNSLAEEIGIESGDYLLALDNQVVNDLLDYYFLISDDYVELLIEKYWGEQWLIEVEKEFDELLGVEFENPTINSMKHCKNNCIFCFVNQLPKGMRDSLYVKDDDYRLSPFHGNYITLTNLDEHDLNKMINYRISPMYISVHTTNPDLRVYMLNNPKAAHIKYYLQKFKSAGIEMHGQIVLCPEINDGEELKKSIENLSELYPEFQSLAIVPVGLTKYREGNDLSRVSPKLAEQVIENVHSYQNKYYNELGTRFVFLSDEFYLLANREFPDFDSYENFSQIDNGVGLSVKFEREALDVIVNQDDMLVNCNNITGTIITGKLGALVLKRIFNNLLKHGLTRTPAIEVIDNNFFGQQVTVTGLITGKDIIDQTKPRLNENSLYGPLLIPDVMLKDEQNMFLDDITLEQLANTLDVEVLTVPTTGDGLIKTLMSIGN